MDLRAVKQYFDDSAAIPAFDFDALVEQLAVTATAAQALRGKRAFERRLDALGV